MTEATFAAIASESGRRRRPSIVSALDGGALDDVPIAIACVCGTDIVSANAEWRSLIGCGDQPSVRHGWLAAFEVVDHVSIENCLDDGDADVDATLADSDRSERRVRIRCAPVNDQPGYKVVTVATVGLSAASEERLTHRATHDDLTGLANRAHFLAQVEHQLESQNGPAGLLFIDLDNFKEVNDHLGHRVGDAVLQAVSERVSSVVRDGVIVGRLGGDEIAVFCPIVESRHDAFRLAERINRVIAHPFSIGDETIIIDASTGIAFSSPLERGAINLVDRADRAMYAAKDAGGGRWATADHDHGPADADQVGGVGTRWPRVRLHIDRAEGETARALRHQLEVADPEGAWQLDAIRCALRRVALLLRCDSATDVVDTTASIRRNRIDDEIAARVAVAQAQGVIADRSGGTISQAAATLREHAGGWSISVRKTALLIIDAAARLTQIGGGRPQALQSPTGTLTTSSQSPNTQEHHDDQH